MSLAGSSGDDGKQKKVRILQCMTCKTMEVIPYYEGDPNYDVLLHAADDKHGGHEEDPLRNHLRAIHEVVEALWDNPRVRRQMVKQMWSGTKGFTPEYYDVKDTYKDDAMKCFQEHRRPGRNTHRCSDYRNSNKRIGNPAYQDRVKMSRELRDHDLRYSGPKVYLCQFCLTADTEVVTREGIRPIHELVGKPVELLVPFMVGNGGKSFGAAGAFREAEVRYFGMQSVNRIWLKRGKTRRYIDATDEHRWFVRTTVNGQIVERTTVELSAGDALQPIKAVPPRGREKPVPFGVAQGFVFGDGSHGHNDHRPATLPLYGVKDEVMAPYFDACDWVMQELNGQQVKVFTSLPRHWKQLPPIDESRSFLLSWLAGYFAADGYVSDVGQVTLNSANRLNLEFSRSAAAVCGVGTGPISMKMRRGTGIVDTPVYGLSLAARDLPDWFWLIEGHNARIVKLHGTKPRDRVWRVESVTSIGGVQPVYCAVVDGVGAFGLADDLLTGNCPYESEVNAMKADKFGDFSEKLN